MGVTVIPHSIFVWPLPPWCHLAYTSNLWISYKIEITCKNMKKFRLKNFGKHISWVILSVSFCITSKGTQMSVSPTVSGDRVGHLVMAWACRKKDLEAWWMHCYRGFIVSIILKPLQWAKLGNTCFFTVYFHMDIANSSLPEAPFALCM